MCNSRLVDGNCQLSDCSFPLFSYSLCVSVEEQEEIAAAVVGRVARAFSPLTAISFHQAIKLYGPVAPVQSDS